MTFSSYEEYHLGLIEYMKKNVELKMVKRNLTIKNNVLQLKKKLLKEKYKELGNVNYNVWVYKDKFCNDIWNFSLEHNFNHFFNQYPEVLKISNIHKCKCKYTTINDEDVQEMDIHNENILLQLKNEIDIFKNHIILIHNGNVERDLGNYKCTLHNLKSFSEEILELIRLVTTLETSSNMYNTNQQSNMCTKGFISARKMFQKHTFDNRMATKKVLTPTSTVLMEELKKSYKIRSNIRFGKFTMKKQSDISLKFENNQWNSVQN